MAKPVKALIIAVVIIALLSGAGWLLLKSPAETPDEIIAGKETAKLLTGERAMDEVASVVVKNSHGMYTVEGKDGAYRLHDLPAEHVNVEYLGMLLDECSRIEYLDAVSDDLTKLAEFGLEKPEAEVSITYTDGTKEELLIGAKEPISKGRYFMEKGGSQILIMKDSRSIRFTMEVEKYLDFIIIPPEETASILGELQDMTFSGRSIPEPIEIKAVLPEREDLQKIGISFGSVTHLLMGDGVYEADAGKLLEIGQDLLGLISEGIVAYNCSAKELAAYGFDDPYLRIDFDYKNGKDAEVVPYTLRVSELDGEYIVTVNDEGIVYKVLDLSFLHVAYEDLVLRWFLSPFISDVEELGITVGGQEYNYVLSGENVKEIQVSCNGAVIDDELFRKFYNLVTSAASDGSMLPAETEVNSDALAVIRYSYKAEGKPDDVIKLYPGELRRLYVEVNGSCRFTMRENFLNVLKNANDALLLGETFDTSW